MALEDAGHGETVRFLPDAGKPARNVPLLGLETEGHRLIDLRQSNQGHYIPEPEKTEG